MGRLVIPALLAVLVPAPALAVPGPDSTAVLASSNDPDSVALAEEYAAARQVPGVQVCALPIPQVVDLTLAQFQDDVLVPLQACLDASAVTSRIEAVVIMRGVPLRVLVPTTNAGTQTVSLAAALAVWKSTFLGAGPLLGGDPGTLLGQDTSCPGCYAATWANPYFNTGAFKAGWTATASGVKWRPLLVTMLNGRTYDEAATLIDSALAAEAGEAPGSILLMKGADGARGVLDRDYDDDASTTPASPGVQTLLTARGVKVLRSDFAPDLTGLKLAGFVTGTASIGSTIEGNTYLPGSITDNLTSFGAAPVNFTQDGEAQVSIARWVGQGAAGAHGTVDEPLNNVFPRRFFLVRYVDGFTLAESYWMMMPAVYWRNLVLGDPMLAPYAVRPQVAIELGDCVHVDGTRTVQVTATDAEKRGIASLKLFADGQELKAASASSLKLDVTFPAHPDVQLLAVAQKRADTSDRGIAQPKGWTELRVDGTEALPACDDTGMGGSGGGGNGGGGGEGGMGGPGGGGGGGSGGEATGGSGGMPGGSGGTGAEGGSGGATGGSGGSGIGAGGSGGARAEPKKKDEGGCSASGGAGLLGIAAIALLLRRRR